MDLHLGFMEAYLKPRKSKTTPQDIAWHSGGQETNLRNETVSMQDEANANMKKVEFKIAPEASASNDVPRPYVFNADELGELYAEN